MLAKQEVVGLSYYCMRIILCEFPGVCRSLSVLGLPLIVSTAKFIRKKNKSQKKNQKEDYTIKMMEITSEK